MKKELPEMIKQFSEREDETRKSSLPARSSGDIDKAIKLIYERYGNNLPAFFRDAYKEVALKLKKSSDNIEVRSL